MAPPSPSAAMGCAPRNAAQGRWSPLRKKESRRFVVNATVAGGHGVADTPGLPRQPAAQRGDQALQAGSARSSRSGRRGLAQRRPRNAVAACAGSSARTVRSRTLKLCSRPCRPLRGADRARACDRRMSVAIFFDAGMVCPCVSRLAACPRPWRQPLRRSEV